MTWKTMSLFLLCHQYSFMWFIFLFFFRSWVLMSKPWKKQIRLPNLSIPSLQIRSINFLAFCHRLLVVHFPCTITSYLHLNLCTTITISTKVRKTLFVSSLSFTKFSLTSTNTLWCFDNLAKTQKAWSFFSWKNSPL